MKAVQNTTLASKKKRKGKNDEEKETLEISPGESNQVKIEASKAKR